ncbi:ATP-binding cassette domain-containing protein [Kaistia terrae]|uniref:ATP-binding cassette domain-containing protein n=1 Tax=Kaistia terrae TaxID=537017 RepID=A0ABW0PNP5_9HYPH|nr:ATP-binding cassette domain-containing protein [Kaistia terrae]MCX5580072.1 ATP-binding cassette domain-containing protein [Kaistia terrae]
MSIASSAAASAAPIRMAVECRSIRKAFPGVLALDDVSLSIRQGEIHALLGQNGAGKSTLVKVLTGVYQPEEGRIFIDGKEVRLRDVREAEANGIAIVHQDQPLIAQFDVTSNALLGNELVRIGGLLDRKAMRSRVQEALDRVQADFSPDTLVRDLSVAQRAQVSIAAALLRNPTALILDEPTASLSDKEAERLFGIIRALRSQGVTIIYISHYLDEVLNLVDRISVLRDGKLVATVSVSEVARSDLVRMIVGRDVSQLYPKEKVAIGAPLLEVRGLTLGSTLHGIDLTVRRGEILGIAGLVGAGRSELALTLVGALTRDSGTVTIDGKPSNPADPRIAKEHGFALIPEDRRHEGLIADLAVRENLTLPNISRWARFGLLNWRAEAAAARELVTRLDIQPPSIKPQIRNLSGGNQQKVVVGRWLTGESRVFLFDEPTTGVDVGSKIEIYRQMVELARSGAAVIFISSDFEEISAMCDRTMVMQKGRISKVIEDQREATPEALLFWASGSAESEKAERAEAEDANTEKASSRSVAKRALSRWGTVIGMLLVVGAIAALAPQFVAPGNIFDVLKQGSVLAFIALGLTVVLIAGGFDMSAGAASQFAANIAAGTLLSGFGSVAAIALGGAFGFVIGAINAGLVLVLRIPAFVATLGMMFVIMGATLLFNGGQALTLSNMPGFFFLGQGYVGPVPFVFILLVAFTLGLHVVLKKTRLGLRMYAVGQNAAAAALRGVGQSRYAFASFALGGLVLGLAGVVLAAYSYGASAMATGIDFLISALAATFLGSTISRAGELDVIGTVIAAIFLASLSNGLILMGVSNQALPGIQGIVLVLSILLGLSRKRGIGQVLIF